MRVPPSGLSSRGCLSSRTIEGNPTHPHPQPPCLVPDQFSLQPSSGFHWSAVTRHPSSPSIPLTTQGLGNQLCLMCWQFHLTLLSLISLASSLLLVACDCLPSLHFSTLPPSSPGSGLLSPPIADADAEKVNERVGEKDQWGQIRSGGTPQSECANILSRCCRVFDKGRGVCLQTRRQWSESIQTWATASTCLSLYVF